MIMDKNGLEKNGLSLYAYTDDMVGDREIGDAITRFKKEKDTKDSNETEYNLETYFSKDKRYSCLDYSKELPKYCDLDNNLSIQVFGDSNEKCLHFAYPIIFKGALARAIGTFEPEEKNFAIFIKTGNDGQGDRVYEFSKTKEKSGEINYAYDDGYGLMGKGYTLTIIPDDQIEPTEQEYSEDEKCDTYYLKLSEYDYLYEEYSDDRERLYNEEELVLLSENEITFNREGNFAPLDNIQALDTEHGPIYNAFIGKYIYYIEEMAKIIWKLLPEIPSFLTELDNTAFQDYPEKLEPIHFQLLLPNIQEETITAPQAFEKVKKMNKKIADLH